jgi:hypothetical protein
MESAIESPAKLVSRTKDAQNASGLFSSEAVLDIYRLQKSKAPQEKVSCARQHFLSHRGLWQHSSDFSSPDHR